MFITFEGGDGSGKSTQIEKLKCFLEQEGYQVLLTREPGGTQISEQVRQILLDPDNTKMSAITEMILYAAARAQLVEEVIRPALEQGTIVICDRFLDSSIAYQGYGRGLGDAVAEVNGIATGGLAPDLTIYLRLSPDKGRSRIKNREQDRIELESETFHDKVFQGYEALCRLHPDRIFTVDASQSIDTIAEKIKARVREKINELST